MMPLLDATIKMSVIVSLALIAVRLPGGHSAAVRHWMLAAAIGCAAAAPLIALVVPPWQAGFVTASWLQRDGTTIPPAAGRLAREAYPDAFPDQNVARGDTASPSIAAGRTGHAPARGAADWLAAVWLAGVAAGLSVLGAGLLRLRWLQSRAAPVGGGRWLAIGEDIARRYGLRRMPLLLQSDHPSLLVTWGLRRAKVILPAPAPAWTDDRIRVVLAHELAHIRRHDWLLQFAAEVLCRVYWFNPLLWIGCRALRQHSEQACDDAVLRLGVDGRSYAAHLLALARAFSVHRRAWFPAPAIARQSSLERRISAMLDSRANRGPVTPFAAAVVTAALLGVTIPIAGLDAFAQNRFATLWGTATDESGAVLVNATIALSNIQTGAKYEVRTTRSGSYEFVGLPAGEYRFEARIAGFEVLEDTIRLNVGENLQKSPTLRVGAVQETIRVVGGPDQPVDRRDRVVTAPPPGRRPCPNPAVGGCIDPPRKVKDVRPVFPAALRDTGIEGTVLIEGEIGTDGRMKYMRIVSSPHPAFERSALDAVAEWEFTPTTLNDRAIDTRINVSVSFAPAEP